MRLYIIIACSFFFSCSSPFDENDFENFIGSLKKNAQSDELDKVGKIFTDHYIASLIYLHHLPKTSPDQIRKEHAESFIGFYIKNEDIIEVKNESFEMDRERFVWLRNIEFENDKGKVSRIDYDFIVDDGKFVASPHDTHPTQEQLQNLKELDNIYSLYYAVSNAKSVQITVNDIAYAPYDSGIYTTQIHDVKKGDNTFKFEFIKEDDSQPIQFATSIVFVDKETVPRVIENDNVIHLRDKAMVVHNMWGSLSFTDKYMSELDSETYETTITLN